MEHLALFGSYAKGTATKYSDLDFIIYGPVDMEKLREQIDEIMTLKKIDLFDVVIERIKGLHAVSLYHNKE